MKYLLVFIAVTLLDVVWAKYIAAVGAKQRWRAAAFSSLTFVLSGCVVIQYTKEPGLLLAAVAGAFVGTLIAVRSE